MISSARRLTIRPFNWHTRDSAMPRRTAVLGPNVWAAIRGNAGNALLYRAGGQGLTLAPNASPRQRWAEPGAA